MPHTEPTLESLREQAWQQLIESGRQLRAQVKEETRESTKLKFDHNKKNLAKIKKILKEKKRIPVSRHVVNMHWEGNLHIPVEGLEGFGHFKITDEALETILAIIVAGPDHDDDEDCELKDYRVIRAGDVEFDHRNIEEEVKRIKATPRNEIRFRDLDVDYEWVMF